jgi:hypothetical protein
MPVQDPQGGGPKRRIPQQISRLLIVFALALIALIVLRRVMTPKTFGELGHYRAAAIDQVAALDVKYAGRGACAECHDDVAGKQGHARHQTLSCETCHGPAAEHIKTGGEVKPIVPRERTFCPRCHGYDSARPTGFPQIDPATHNPVKRCVTCHNPHDPTPPNVPSSCGACHGEIARLKAVSPHTELACTRCHETDDQHRDTPRLSRPTKPTSREFCGTCHGKDAKQPADLSSEPPHVDLATHGRNYLCWQCHYPHDPEVR